MKIWRITWEKYSLVCTMKSSALQRFVGFVQPVHQIQHFERKIDDERVQQIARDGVHAAHVDLDAPQPATSACRSP